MKIPVAHQSLLMDSFKCHVCQTAPICPRHLCTLLQIYNRNWNMCGHMVSWGRWHIMKLSLMPHWEGTTWDNEAVGFGWFPEGDQASCWWTSKFQYGWVGAFFTCTGQLLTSHRINSSLPVAIILWSLFLIQALSCVSDYNFSLSAYHFQYLLIGFISLYSHLTLYHT